MGSSGQQDVDAVFDALDAAWDRACALNFDALNPQQQLAVLRRCEKQRRRIPAVEHPLINPLARQAPPWNSAAHWSMPSPRRH